MSRDKAWKSSLGFHLRNFEDSSQKDLLMIPNFQSIFLILFFEIIIHAFIILTLWFSNS